jgi:4-alpha-glucanotransferase
VNHSDRRRAGLLIPLFAFPSSTSWGIGDIGDIPAIATWLAGAGQRVLQLLPINEMASGQQSPYSAMSAMAIDPIFIRLTDVPEYVAIGGEKTLSAEERAELASVRRAPHVDYPTIRRLKQQALAVAFDRFREHEWNCDTARAREFKEYVDVERWWIDDYALFRALHEREEGRPWTEWPDPLRHRDLQALVDARRDLANDIRFRQYLQWIAEEQWRRARTRSGALGVELFGDLPFMVDGDSADVWARQSDFHLDASVGVPPDAFSATGQDWGMPAYKWGAIAQENFRWLRDRARRSAALYDGYRIDHLVGFYRTYSRPRNGGPPSFEPKAEPDQQQLGEQLMSVFREPGAEIFAEDLGVVPDFVRASLARQHIAGFRVFRWEREWNIDGHPFRDPAGYPPVSVATSGTHDTEPMAIWWDEAVATEKALIAELPGVRQAAGELTVQDAPFIPTVRDALLETLFGSGSNLLLIPVQDVFGWRDRINVPATVTDSNWSYRLPWPSDRLDDEPEAQERKQTLRAWATKYRRYDSAS